MKVNNILKVSNNEITSLGLQNQGLRPYIPTSPKDSFQKNPYSSSPVKNSAVVNPNNLYSSKQLLKAYANTAFINSLIEKNPKIKDILAQNNLSVEIHPENIQNIINSHLSTTNLYAMKMANKMNLSQSDKKILEKACYFHDFGKILIPKQIITKPAELTPEEKNIMDLHSELGYELLSSVGMDKKVLELIRNHHKAHNEDTDVLGEILSVADIYSALREQRCYKDAMPIEEAIKLLDQKAKNGEVSTEVVEALKKSITESESYAA